MAGLPPPDPNYIPYTLTLFKETVAPLTIGIVISFVLFGIGVVQGYNCLLLFYQLPSWVGQELHMFYFLAFLMAADLADSIGKGMFLMQHLQNVIVKGLLGSGTFPRVAFSLPITDTVITMLNHLAYGYRVWRICPGKWLDYVFLAIAAGFSITQFVACVITSLAMYDPVSEWMPDILPQTLVWLGAAAIADILLVLQFVYYLGSHKSDYQQTNFVIMKWIILSLETGILPAALQLLSMIFACIYPEKPYEVSVAIIQPKIYINGILLVMHTILTNRVASHASSIEGSIPHASLTGANRPGGAGAYGGSMQLQSFGPAQGKGMGVSMGGAEGPVVRQVQVNYTQDVRSEGENVSEKDLAKDHYRFDNGSAM